mmetsp:Transcript_58584/g.156829  ORF Transcript_58584/g.156829 Transcript_58584/m.156829 type:complete len:377 (-) Transcript_58584:12-1142(-)
MQVEGWGNSSGSRPSEQDASGHNVPDRGLPVLLHLLHDLLGADGELLRNLLDANGDLLRDLLDAACDPGNELRLRGEVLELDEVLGADQLPLITQATPHEGHHIEVDCVLGLEVLVDLGKLFDPIVGLLQLQVGLHGGLQVGIVLDKDVHEGALQRCAKVFPLRPLHGLLHQTVLQAPHRDALGEQRPRLPQRVAVHAVLAEGHQEVGILKLCPNVLRKCAAPRHADGDLRPEPPWHVVDGEGIDLLPVHAPCCRAGLSAPCSGNSQQKGSKGGRGQAGGEGPLICPSLGLSGSRHCRRRPGRSGAAEHQAARGGQLVDCPARAHKGARPHEPREGGGGPEPKHARRPGDSQGLAVESHGPKSVHGKASSWAKTEA